MKKTTIGRGPYMINEVSQRVGLSHKRIREYEKEGFIKPDRQPRTNNRCYTQADVEQILHIKEMIHGHGFTLACLKYFITSAPCWTVFNCDRKADCPIYQEPQKHCYEIVAALKSPGHHGDCSRCPIYLNRNLKQRELPALLKRN